MLDLMLKKGVITQKDYDEFMQANKDADENKAFKDSRIDKDVSKSITFIQKRANDGAVKPSGFGWVSGDGKSELNLTGRMHIDTRFFNSMIPDDQRSDSDAARSGNQMDFRRARIGFTGKLWNDFNYEMVWNAVVSGGTSVDTSWLNYSAKKEAQFRIGKFKQPFNLEDYATSSNNIDFIERSYVNVINPGKRTGMMLHGVPSDGTAYAVSLFQQDDAATSASGHFQAAGRFATDLGKAARWTDKFLHLGVAGTYGSYDTTNSGTAPIQDIRTEHRGMNAFTPTFVTNTGANTGLRGEITKELRGAEFAYGQGAFKIQAEMAEADFNARNVGSQIDVVRGKYRMHYVAFVYNLTGENWYDSYKDGAFSSIKIKSNYDSSGSGIGAWQIGLRFSGYDATDLQATGLAAANQSSMSSITGLQGSNKGKTTTIGLTWFINPNSRVMLNHSMTTFDQPITNTFLGLAGTVGTAVGDRESVTTLRAQYNF
ncbi:MAG: OprO/OprP family phosphate-selective porin [Burkholderiaceae bacterium]